jgi:hypothetical protein
MFGEGLETVVGTVHNKCLEKDWKRVGTVTLTVAVEGLHGESKFDKGSELLYHKTLLPPMATATVMASPDLMGWS